MNEEKFNRQEADAMTNRIADRLGERQQKLERMADMERATKATHLRPLYWAGAAAACIAVVMLMMPFWRTPSAPLDDLGIAAPTLTEYRAATPEVTAIAELMDRQDYEKALTATETALAQSERELKDLEGLVVGWDDEEMIYQLEQEIAMNGELRWTYIYLLVKTGRDKEAKKQLKYFVKNHSNSEHIEEARRLLEEM